MEKIVDQSTTLQIISLVGKQGAGKTVTGTLLARKLGAVHVEASAVVRHICGDMPRSKMHTTNERTKDDPGWLARGIMDFIHMGYKDPQTVVLTGVREVEVHDYLDIDVFIVYLEAPAEIRFERLKHYGKVGTLDEFILHEFNELNLGLDDLIKDAHAVVSSTADTPDDLVKTISDLVETHGSSVYNTN